MDRPSDFALRWLAPISRRLPPWRVCRFLARQLRKSYLRSHQEPVLAEVAGSRMRLAPGDYVEGQLLFGPQFYEPGEREYVRTHLRRGDCFVDLGSHVGLYTLLASRAVGAGGSVVAVEADPQTHARLVENLRLNELANVKTFQCGVSDRAEIAMLSVDTGANRGASSFLVAKDEQVEVECLPLTAILEKAGVSHVHGMKLDIEGLEFRVLKRFFEDGVASLYPDFVLIEQKDWWIERAGGNAVELLEQHGYRIAWHAADRKKWPNYVLVRD